MTTTTNTAGPLIVDHHPMNPQPLIEAVEKALLLVPRGGNSSVFIAKINGKPVKTNSGKTSWRRMGDAKNSIRQTIDHQIRSVLVNKFNFPAYNPSMGPNAYPSYNRYENEVNEIIQWMYDNKIIEIERVQ